MATKLVTVFGASGFLGRHVIRELIRDGWRIRIAARRPHTAHNLPVSGGVGQISLIQANIRYKKSVVGAIKGADAVISMAGISYKKGRQTFAAVHALGVRAIAEAAKESGITNVVHVSALGVNTKSTKTAMSDFIRSKLDGEQALLEIVPSADILRPATMYGEGKGIFTKISRAAQFSPVIPLFGGGATRLQPVYVGDVAKAVSTVITRGSNGKIYELAGPRTYTLKELILFTLDATNKKRILLPVPWVFGSATGLMWEVLGAIPILNLLIKPFITRDQIKEWKSNNTVSGNFSGFADLDIHVETIESIVPSTLEHFKKYGQFHQKQVQDTP